MVFLHCGCGRGSDRKHQPSDLLEGLEKSFKEIEKRNRYNCNGLKLQAPDGKMRLTDVADTEQLFRLIQSILSPKAEPFKQQNVQIR